MLGTGKFAGDDDPLVIDIQHDAYGGSVGLLVGEVCRAFLFANAVVGGMEEVAERVRQVRSQGCDHRILSAVHGQVAACFRKENKEDLNPILPLDGPVSEHERIESRWRKYWASAVREICEDPTMLRTAARCIATSGGPSEGESEDLLLKLVAERFPTGKVH